MSNNTQAQAIVYPKEFINVNQPASELTLFNPNGTPYLPAVAISYSDEERTSSTLAVAPELNVEVKVGQGYKGRALLWFYIAADSGVAIQLKGPGTTGGVYSILNVGGGLADYFGNESPLTFTPDSAGIHCVELALSFSPGTEDGPLEVWWAPTGVGTPSVTSIPGSEIRVEHVVAYTYS